MKKHPYVVLALIFFVGVVWSQDASAGKIRQLSAAEVRAAFTNKTLLGDHYQKRKRMRIFSGPNGEWWSMPGPKKTLKFRWYVNSSGHHCKVGRGEHGCGPIMTKGQPNVYYKFHNGKEHRKFVVIGRGNQLAKQKWKKKRRR